MIDFSKYFEANSKYYLNKLTFDHSCFSMEEQTQKVTLSIVDQVRTEYVKNKGIIIEFSRELSNNDNPPPMIQVSFCTELTFKEGVEQEVEWESVPLAKEIAESSEYYISNLVSRASLLIAEITASYGQIPIVTPPTINTQS